MVDVMWLMLLSVTLVADIVMVYVNARERNAGWATLFAFLAVITSVAITLRLVVMFL